MYSTHHFGQWLLVLLNIDTLEFCQSKVFVVECLSKVICIMNQELSAIYVHSFSKWKVSWCEVTCCDFMAGQLHRYRRVCTGYLWSVFRDLVSADQHWEWISSIIRFVYLPNLHSVINQIILQHINNNKCQDTDLHRVTQNTQIRPINIYSFLLSIQGFCNPSWFINTCKYDSSKARSCFTVCNNVFNHLHVEWKASFHRTWHLCHPIHRRIWALFGPAPGTVWACQTRMVCCIAWSQQLWFFWLDKGLLESGQARSQLYLHFPGNPIGK